MILLKDYTYVMTYLRENQSNCTPVFLQEKFASQITTPNIA